MTEWQPIETAPRDGRKVILCQVKHGVYAQWPETFYWDGDWYSAIDGCAINADHTHWMPLPTPSETNDAS